MGWEDTKNVQADLNNLFNTVFYLRYSADSKISIISAGVTTIGVWGECFLLPSPDMHLLSRGPLRRIRHPSDLGSVQNWQYVGVYNCIDHNDAFSLSALSSRAKRISSLISSSVMS